MDKKHKILFSKGKLFLDNIQIAGEGITPEKDVLFEFSLKEEIQREVKVKDPSILEVSVVDAVNSRDVGPGQRG